ncbi:MAG TPA: hypothetical protein VI636_07600 [Candidatus Angelobacter sp.]
MDITDAGSSLLFSRLSHLLRFLVTTNAPKVKIQGAGKSGVDLGIANDALKNLETTGQFWHYLAGDFVAGVATLR